MTDPLCPRFVDVEGAVLLETSAHPKGFRSWKEDFDGDLRVVESMLNQEHVWDFLPGDGDAHEAALEISLCGWISPGRERPRLSPRPYFGWEVTDEYAPMVTTTTALP